MMHYAGSIIGQVGGGGVCVCCLSIKVCIEIVMVYTNRHAASAQV